MYYVYSNLAFTGISRNFIHIPFVHSFHSAKLHLKIYFLFTKMLKKYFYEVKQSGNAFFDCEGHIWDLTVSQCYLNTINVLKTY